MQFPKPAIWHHDRNESFADLIGDIGGEAVSAVLYRVFGKALVEANKWAVERGLPAEAMGALEAFYINYEAETIRTAVWIGYALALTRPDLGSFEEWAQEAIVKAGLEQPGPERHFKPENEHRVACLGCGKEFNLCYCDQPEQHIAYCDPCFAKLKQANRPGTAQ